MHGIKCIDDGCLSRQKGVFLASQSAHSGDVLCNRSAFGLRAAVHGNVHVREAPRAREVRPGTKDVPLRRRCCIRLQVSGCSSYVSEKVFPSLFEDPVALLTALGSSLRSFLTPSLVATSLEAQTVCTVLQRHDHRRRHTAAMNCRCIPALYFTHTQAVARCVSMPHSRRKILFWRCSAPRAPTINGLSQTVSTPYRSPTALVMEP